MTSAAPGAIPADSDKLDKGVLKIAGVTVLGAIMAILDTTVVSVALTTFQTVFEASTATVAWTMTGYTLALATVIPLTGWAADRFGTKRLYMVSIGLFLIGSVLCGLAWDITSLIVFRVLQGLGGGMLMPLGMTMLTRAAGPTRVGRVMAVLGVPMLLGPILGPILGGWLIDIASWHWIFFINVPIGLGALYAAWKILPKDTPTPSESFDFVGMALLSPGLAAFLYGVSSIPEVGTFAHARVLAPALIGLALMVAFVFHALRKDHPLIDLHLFRNRNLTVSVLTMSLFAIAFFGAMLLFPLYFQQVRLESSLSAGLLLAPQGLGAMLTMPIAGRLTDKYGPGRFVLTGIVLIGGGLAVFTQLTATTPYGVILPVLFVMGMGMGMTMMPVMSAAMSSLTHHEVARGSTLMNIVQQSAGSIGTALMSVILTNQFLSKPSGDIAQVLRDNPAAAADPQLLGQLLTPEQLQLVGQWSAQPGGLQAVLAGDMASGFGVTFIVATVLVAACLIPAFFLPRKRSEALPEGEQAQMPVAMH
ncbi:DHA2 family efflux MFS transporter permease subunit [Nakamurella sp. YIM 132087]|uniref:DHA2 family efflux MFS transporter permease subunit n=1 Tax=Nakamurella alba TaxID=2665158 RepID=A0A7K1FT87_9ACTN|nr:DHA2 family efflux MFS transporter permease subunit [Nakamurella alba]MTD16393.1 DHA2 family efflux MFS transporter permease subunit [Nakamurella alba]